MMEIDYLYDGRVERIPPIGSQIQLQPHLFFVVEGYGSNERAEEAVHTRSTGETYCLKLKGHLLIPAGSPIEVLDNLLKP